MCSCATSGRFDIFWNWYWRKIVYCFVKGCKSFLLSPLLMWRPLKVIKHGCNTSLIWINSSDKAGTLSLKFFYCQNILFVVRVPNWWRIFHMWPYKCGKSPWLAFLITAIEMPSEEVQDPLSFACDITDVGSPGKIRSEFYTKIGMVADFLEQDVINGILCGQGFFCLVILSRWHFAALNLISQVLDHSTMVFKSCWSCSSSAKLLMVL